MRITFKNRSKRPRGKHDGLVIMSFNRGRVTVARRYVRPKLPEHQQIFCERQKNLAAVWAECSTAFKDDLTKYAQQLIRIRPAGKRPAGANYSHFLRFIYNYQAENPELDLTTVTKDQLVIAGCPDTVAGIAAHGLLPEAGDLTGLTNKW